MKKSIIAGLVALTALSSASAFAGATVANGFGCPNKNKVYFAYTDKHTKAVELCRVGRNYRYTFGPINKPELQVSQPATRVGFYGGMGGGFEFKNGAYRYTVSEDKFGNADLEVSRGERILAQIPLDTGFGNSINNTFEMLNP